MVFIQNIVKRDKLRNPEQSQKSGTRIVRICPTATLENRLHADRNFLALAARHGYYRKFVISFLCICVLVGALDPRQPLDGSNAGDGAVEDQIAGLGVHRLLLNRHERGRKGIDHRRARILSCVGRPVRRSILVPASDPSLPPRLRRGEVLTREELLAACGASKRTLAKWIAAGLAPLASFTREDLFLTDEVIDTWIKLRDTTL
jgi:hypothetical protein